MDATNTLIFPSAKEFVLTKHYRNEEYNYDTYGYCNFTHPRKGYWTGEIKIADSTFEDMWLSARWDGTRAKSTNGVTFVEMEDGTVSGANAITLAYTPVANTVVQVFDPDNRVDWIQAVAAATPNVYSIAGGVLTFPAGYSGEHMRINYFRTTTTCVKDLFSPYSMPSAFKLYCAQATIWAATGTKYFETVYARACVPTGELKQGLGDVTLNFNINNVVTDDLIIWRSQITE